MILDRAFVAAGDKYHVGNAGGNRLIDCILDERLVDDRQHLFGARLGGRQEAGAQPRDGKYCFGDSSQFTTSLVSRGWIQLSESNFSSPSSSSTGTSSVLAFSYLLPGSAPTTT